MKLSKPDFFKFFFLGEGGLFSREINDLMGLITPLYLYVTWREGEIRTHLCLKFEWVNWDYNLYLEVAF
jgi:hypothetical protein